MKKYLLLLCALALVFTQCKKKPLVEPTTPETPGNGTYLKVNVGFDEKTSMVENGTVAISWVDGDKLCVVKGGSCIGTLKYLETNNQFTGEVSGTLNVNDCLYLYYLGNITVENGAKSATMDFSEQGTLNGLSGIGSFHAGISEKVVLTDANVNNNEAITTTMKSMTSIAKFTFPVKSNAKSSYTNPIAVSGDCVYTELTVDFSDMTFKGNKTQKTVISIGTGESATKYFALIPSTDKETTLTFNGQPFVFNNGIKANKLYKKENGDALTVEMPEPGVAANGGTEYKGAATGLQDAINNVTTDNNVVTLVSTAELTSPVQTGGVGTTVSAPYTLNLNGNTITNTFGTGDSPEAVIKVTGSNTVTISGEGTITAGDAQPVIDVTGTAKDVKLFIAGGTYNKNPENKTTFSKGGNENYSYGKITPNSDGTWTVTDNRVAIIVETGEKYTKLEDAFSAANALGTATIKMLEDYQLDLGNAGVTVNAGSNITLDLNGRTVKNRVETNDHSQVILNNGTLTIMDSGYNGTLTEDAGTTTVGEWWGTVQYNYTTNVITNCGTLYVNGGRIVQSAAGSICYCVDARTNGGECTVNTTFNGGTIINNSKTAVRMFCNSTTNENNMTINDINLTYGRFGVILASSNKNANKGNLTIKGGEFTSVSDDHYDVYVETEGSDCDNSQVFFNVTGGIFHTRVVCENISASNVDITGGTFGEFCTENPSVFKVLKGGSYTVNPKGDDYDYVASGYKVTGTGPYTVVKDEDNPNVAYIGETGYETLKEAFDAVTTSDATTIRLVKDCTVDMEGKRDGIVIGYDKNITLDLNGKTVSGASHAKLDGNISMITNYGNLKIKDSGSNGKITYYYDGVSPEYGFSTNTVANCVTANNSQPDAKLTVESGIIENTTSVERNIAYAIDNLTNTGTQKAILTISGGKFYSLNGDAVIRMFINSQTGANNVTINGGDFYGWVFFVQNPVTGSGQQVGSIDINAGNFYNSEKVYWLDLGCSDATNFTSVNVNVNGGYFDGKMRIRDNVPNHGVGVVVVKGGTFTSNEVDGPSETKTLADYVASGYKAVQGGDVWTVVKSDGVCKIGNTEYATLEEAFTAANTLGTAIIQMLADYQLAEGNAGVTVNAGKNITLDLNGKTVKNKVISDSNSQTIENFGTLTITGNGTLTNDVNGHQPGSPMTYNWFTNVITNHATLTIENGNIVQTANGSACYCVDAQTNSGYYTINTTINDGQITGPTTTIRLFCNSTTNENNMTINGGNINSGKYGIMFQCPNVNANKGKLVVNGGEFTSSATSYPLNIYTYAAESSNTENFRLSIKGGKFNNTVATSGAVSATVVDITNGEFNKFTSYADGDFKVLKGGIYHTDPTENVASGYEAVQSGDVWTVQEAQASGVCKIGTTYYETLAEAITAATDGQTVEIIESGTYTLPDIQKQITVKAAENVSVAVMYNSAYNQCLGRFEGVTFDHITFSIDGNYDLTGFNFNTSGPVTFNYCVFNKRFTTFGTQIFNNCTFNQDASDYIMTTYGPYTNTEHLDFNNCIFNNSALGKFLNVYQQTAYLYTININGCTFNNTGSIKKVAVLVKETDGSGNFTVKFTGENTLNGSFPNDISYDNAVTAMDPTGLWAVEAGGAGATPTGKCKVYVDGTEVYPNSK